MKLSELFRSSAAAFPSIEIVPPLSGIGKDDLLAGLKPLMDCGVRYVNVTTHRDEYRYEERPDGSFVRKVVRSRVSPVAVCAAVRERYGVEVVPHVICAGMQAYEIEALLHDLSFLGIRNLMALRGDSLVGEKRFVPTPGGYAHASQLVGAIRAFPEGGEFCVGVGGYPEKHFEAANPQTDLAWLKAKVDAGADFIITQMFFDNRVFYDFRRRCREAGITVPVIPGLKPLSSARQIDLLPETFSIDIPQELTAEVEKAGEDKEAVYRIGTEWCKAQCCDLQAQGVPAVHFYTMGRPDNVTAILKDCF